MSGELSSSRKPAVSLTAQFRHGSRLVFRQGEYQIISAIDEKAKVVKLACLLHRDRDYRELDQM